MNNNNLTDIVGVALFFLMMAVYCFLHGTYLVKCFEYVVRKRLATYRQWGTKIESCEPTTIKRSIAYISGLTVAALFSFLLAYAVAPTFGNLDELALTVLIAIIAWTAGIAKESDRIQAIETKISRLTNLREIFFTTYSKAEMLSVYESLRHAPSLFWDEYANLPDDKVNKETNSKYREIAAPFHQNWARQTTIILIVVAGVGLAISGVVGIRDWLS